MNQLKKIWSWIGTQENHNALVITLALFGLIIALPYFSKQINNIQVKVDSLDASVQEMYSRNTIEKFSFDNINFNKGEKSNNLEIILKNKPIGNSVMLWFFDQLTNPTNYKVENAKIRLDVMSDVDEEYLKSMSEQNSNIIIVSYIKELTEN